MEYTEEQEEQEWEKINEFLGGDIALSSKQIYYVKWEEPDEGVWIKKARYFESEEQRDRFKEYLVKVGKHGVKFDNFYFGKANIEVGSEYLSVIK